MVPILSTWSLFFKKNWRNMHDFTHKWLHFVTMEGFGTLSPLLLSSYLPSAADSSPVGKIITFFLGTTGALCAQLTGFEGSSNKIQLVCTFSHPNKGP